jgi:hypothetical protein
MRSKALYSDWPRKDEIKGIVVGLSEALHSSHPRKDEIKGIVLRPSDTTGLQKASRADEAH